AIDGPPINEQTIYISNAGQGRRLVWVPVDYFADGEALGPVALTDFDDRGIVALAMGTLRAYPSRVEMRLEPLGDGQVLVAESDRCGSDKDAQGCVRVTRLMTVGRQRFIAASLVDEGGSCAGRAVFPRKAEGVVGNGAARRHYEMRSTVSIAQGAIVVNEDLT